MGYRCHYTLTFFHPEWGGDITWSTHGEGPHLEDYEWDGDEDAVCELDVREPLGDVDPRLAPFMKVVSEIADNHSGFNWMGGEEAYTWYKDRKDVQELSRRFPEVFFTLFVEPREDGNDPPWYYYFKGGKYQEAAPQITYPPFDPEKLKE